MRAVVTLVARYRSPTTFEFANEFCYDVSVGGMFIKSAAPAPAGTLLKLECEADHQTDAKIRGVARVVWVRRESNENGPSGMGVKFVKLEAGSRELIDSILQRLADAGVETRSISAAPEHQPYANSGTNRPVQLVPSTPPAAPEGHVAHAAHADNDSGDAELDAALERGSKSDQLAPSPQVAAELAAAAPAAAAAVAAPIPQSGYTSTGSSRPPAASPSRFGWRFWVFVVAVVLMGIAIADRRGRKPAETDANPGAIAPEAEAPPAAANAPATPPATPANEPDHPALPTPGQPVRQAQVEAPGTAADEPPSAPTTDALGEPLYPGAPSDKQYVIEFVSRPNAAIVSIDEKHTLTTPRVLNMGAMPSKVKVTAKKPGYQSSSIWLPRDGFEAKDGMFYRRVYLTLKPESATP